MATQRIRPRVARSKARRIPRNTINEDIAKLTDHILQRVHASGKSNVMARADIGHLLLQVRTHLKHGEWLAWLKAQMPFTSRTATRAIKLHHFRNNQPQLFDQVAPLGVGKAYVLMEQPPATAKRLVDKSHRIPSTGATKTLIQMTFKELMEVLAARRPSPADHAERLWQSCRRQIGAAVRTITIIVANNLRLDPEEVQELYDTLLHAAGQLASTYRLDRD